MSDTILRAKLIRLAHEHPELREQILPLVASEGMPKEANVSIAVNEIREFFHALDSLLQSIDVENTEEDLGATVDMFASGARSLAGILERNYADVPPSLVDTEDWLKLGRTIRQECSIIAKSRRR